MQHIELAASVIKHHFVIYTRMILQGSTMQRTLSLPQSSGSVATGSCRPSRRHAVRVHASQSNGKPRSTTIHKLIEEFGTLTMPGKICCHTTVIIFETPRPWISFNHSFLTFSQDATILFRLKFCSKLVTKLDMFLVPQCQLPNLVSQT